MTLLYRNQHPEFHGYNERYRGNVELFPIRDSHLRWIEGVMVLLAPRPGVAALEIGCGQGYFLTHARRHLLEERAALGMSADGVEFLGLDGSDVAIGQAEMRDAEISWVNDRLQDFLATHDERLGPRRYDVVIDRGGSTFIASEDEARAILAAIRELLRPAGLFLYAISKSFYYDKAVPRIYETWSRDWMGLLGDSFRASLDMSDSMSHFLVYVK